MSASPYDPLFVRTMRSCAADFVYEGEPAGLPNPANVDDPLGLMRPADVPQSRIHLSHTWIHPVEHPQHWVDEHRHDYDEVLIWTGADPEHPDDLGAELFFEIEGVRHSVTTSGSVYLPAGTRHCPLGFTNVRRPFNFSALSLSAGYSSGDHDAVRSAASVAPPYERLFTRELRVCADDMVNEGEAAGTALPPNLSQPWAIVRADDVPEAKTYITMSWVHPTDEPQHWVDEHEHEYDEVLVWTGSDPDRPHDLGAEVVFEIEGVRHTVTTSGSVYIPAGTKHCPLGFTRVDRPFRFLAIALSGDGHYLPEHERGQR
ncbi:hypothetical protein [Agromyces larvae]|uniref:Cupin domain-containing protein n=1 Tax=Agromyces larvae TaxID=2929802 RepID=A0ABY4BYV0_9MICO|nr:hypothetical protein [Agromyces larvae]UOE44397.1 hypothetical protein MTO99_00970 [Agromyces larvae]